MSSPLDKRWLEEQARSARSTPSVTDQPPDIENMPKCSKCGYIIYGATSFRCPECGTPFSSEELQGDADMQTWLQRQARVERWVFWIGLGTGSVGVGLMVWRILRDSVISCALGPFILLGMIILYRDYISRAAVHWSVLTVGLMWLLAGGCAQLI